MACISNALIVGGGIAGLSSAIALSRNGIHADVVEIADVSLGASLGLSGRATDALVELGIYDRVHAAGTPFGSNPTAAMPRDAAGNLIDIGDMGPNFGGEQDNVVVYRPVLLDIMADTAESLGATIRRGVTTRLINNTRHGVDVTLNDGRQQRYDLLIAADGIGSKTRAELFPDAPKPQYANQFSMRWMAPGPPVADESWYMSPMGEVGFYYLPQGFTYVASTVTMAEPPRFSDAEVRSLFAQLLDSYTAPAIVELRRRLRPDSEVIGKSFFSILVPAPWYRNCAVLIGDAAHATTAHMGMGGGMAVEDSAVLGQCLANAATLDEALGVFMTRRYDRVATVVNGSLALSEMEKHNAPHGDRMAVRTAAYEAISRPY